MSLEIRIDNLEKEVVEMNDNIDDLHDKMDKILQLLETDISIKCDKMNDHINFVESIYDNVKNPLGFLLEKVNYMIESGRDYSYNLLPAVEPNNDGFELDSDSDMD
jgi:wobble nucleotide-excising tRNase